MLQRFHFNVRTGDELLRDREGILLPDIGDAIAEALLCSQVGRGPQDGGLGRKTFEIMDAAGKLLATVPIN